MAVTACPTGIAHTYLAAEALEAAAARAGVDLAVETQGSAGSTPLDPATIAAAEAVVFAVDVGVRDKHRFAGKPVLTSGVKRPVDDADAAYRRAKEAGADVTEPIDQDYGSRDVTVTDPDGNRWSLGTYAGAAATA